MIRPIDIRLNAAHPELPLVEAVTFTGSPSTVLIRGVPPNCGRWAITAVFVAASFPDGSTTTRAAVESAEGVWVATLPATATSGRTANGFRVMADGIDENGEVVTGYILGVADFAVASLDVTPAPQPGETSYQMLYFDEVPSTLRKGDVTKIDGILKFYNGSAWEPFASSVTLDSSVTPTSGNGVKSSGIWSAIWGALSALPTGFASLYDWCVSQLAGKLDKSGGTMTGPLTEKHGLVLGKEVNNDFDGFKVDANGIAMMTNHAGGQSTFGEILTAVQAVPNKANRAANPTAGNLAALDAQGNPTDSQIPAANVAVKGNIPYSLVTKTISNGAVSLDDRASNAVTVSATLSPNTLTINFPTAPTGKLRDFAMRLNIAAGVTAPEIAWPQGVTLENNGGEVPEISDGGTGGSSTILYFSETENDGTTAKFLVKGETLTAITQA